MKTRQIVQDVLAAGACLLMLGRCVHPRPAAAFADHKVAGAELFASRGCAHCHGDDGLGTDRGPSLRLLRKKLSADKIREQIVHGGQGMPAFGDSLQPGEVEDLVAFLRAKTWTASPAKPAVIAPASAPPAPPAPGS